MMKHKYLHPTQEAGKELFRRQIQGNVVMLNLLKFKEVADYSEAEELAPPSGISGKEAYQLYINHTLPLLKASGGEVLFNGKGGRFLIGPEAEKWDAVILVKHESLAKFMEFASDREYLKGVGHRTAALEDSRLLPIEEGSLF
jgi:uncharacterized protein (DUF1330 family)